MLSRYEVTVGLLIAVLGAHLVLLFFIAWQFTRFGRTLGLYFRRARRLAIAMRTGTVMDCDKLIDQLLSAETARAGDTGATGRARHTRCAVTAAEAPRRLAALVAGGGGGSKEYRLVVHGKQPLIISTLLKIVKSRTCTPATKQANSAAMTKTLGYAAIQLYAGVASMFLPIPAENQPELVADLEGDPFVGHALSTATCELYHRYG